MRQSPRSFLRALISEDFEFRVFGDSFVILRSKLRLLLIGLLLLSLWSLSVVFGFFVFFRLYFFGLGLALSLSVVFGVFVLFRLYFFGLELALSLSVVFGVFVLFRFLYFDRCLDDRCLDDRCVDDHCVDDRSLSN